MSSSDWVHINFVEITGETQKALKIRIESGREQWIPISLIADADDYNKGDKNGTISVKEWFAKQENLI